MGLPRPRRPTYPRNQRGPQLTSEPSDSGRHHVITTRSITTAETNLCDPTSVRRQDAAHTKGRQATGRRSQNRNKRSYSAPKNRDRLLVQGYFGQLASGSWRASSEGRELSVGGSNPSPPSRAMDCLASLAMTNLHRRVRQNNPTGKSAKTCPALSAKIFRLTRRANQRYQLARLTRQEGRCARHERAVGCSGRGWFAKTNAGLSRTAKSCGPGAPMLAPSFVGQVLRSDGGKKAGHRGARSKP